MQYSIEIQGRQVKVEISSSALAAIPGEDSLLVEMELYFSCLIRKKVRFYPGKDCPGLKAIEGTDNLFVTFRPVMTQSCDTDYEGDEPPLTDFPIAKPASFVPHWLKVDFKNNQWSGEFGF